MNSTEFDADFERRIVLAQHISCVITLATSVLILILIVTDNDARSKHYRKYLCCLVISSMTFDSFADIYVPLFQFNKGIVYSDSYLSRVIPASLFYAIVLLIFVEVPVSYFACVYYRRSVVLSADRFFVFFSWKRRALYIFVQVYVFVVIAAELYFYRLAMIVSENSMPPELQWVKSKTTYAFLVPDENVDYANYVANPTGALLVLTIAAMILQLLYEVKKGMKNSSTATRRYQRLAVRSLILQGVVPSLTYIIPSVMNTIFELQLLGQEEKYDRIATILSPITVLILTKHTLVNSLTILYCSDNYRRKIRLAVLSIVRRTIAGNEISHVRISASSSFTTASAVTS